MREKQKYKLTRNKCLKKYIWIFLKNGTNGSTKEDSDKSENLNNSCVLCRKTNGTPNVLRTSPGAKPNDSKMHLCVATYRSLITVLWSGGYTFLSTVMLIFVDSSVEFSNPISQWIGSSTRIIRQRGTVWYVACDETRKLLRKTLLDQRKLLTFSARC